MDPFRVDFPVPQVLALEGSAADDGHVEPPVQPGAITPEPAQGLEPPPGAASGTEPLDDAEPVRETAAADEPEAEPEAAAADEPEIAEPATAAAQPESVPAPAPVPAAESPHVDPVPDHAAQPEPDHLAPAEPTTVAELVAATLRAAGVRIAFTVAGESFLSILDALTATGIRVVATRHEGAAAFAAEAYGQLTGRPAACLGTRAVGAANLAIGIHTATADSTPMFVIVGGVDRGLRGREAFQEVDIVNTIGGLAKWAGEIGDAETAAATLEAAVRAAVEGRPGPALIAIPEDVQDLALPEGTRAPDHPTSSRGAVCRRPAGRAQLPRFGRAARHPRRCRCPSRPVLQRPGPLRRAPARARHRKLAAR